MSEGVDISPKRGYNKYIQREPTMNNQLLSEIVCQRVSDRVMEDLEDLVIEISQDVLTENGFDLMEEDAFYTLMDVASRIHIAS